MEKKKICIDFDGVLSEYNGWKGSYHFGKPMKGVKEFLFSLEKSNISFVVLTTRKSKQGIKKWFNEYGLPLPEEITDRKIKAHAYIDDRAIAFDGDFSALTKKMKSFSVHWNDKKPFKELK